MNVIAGCGVEARHLTVHGILAVHNAVDDAPALVAAVSICSARGPAIEVLIAEDGWQAHFDIVHEDIAGIFVGVKNDSDAGARVRDVGPGGEGGGGGDGEGALGHPVAAFVHAGLQQQMGGLSGIHGFGPEEGFADSALEVGGTHGAIRRAEARGAGCRDAGGGINGGLLDAPAVAGIASGDGIGWVRPGLKVFHAVDGRDFADGNFVQAEAIGRAAGLPDAPVERVGAVDGGDVIAEIAAGHVGEGGIGEPWPGFARGRFHDHGDRRRHDLRAPVEADIADAAGQVAAQEGGIGIHNEAVAGGGVGFVGVEKGNIVRAQTGECVLGGQGPLIQREWGGDGRDVARPDILLAGEGAVGGVAAPDGAGGVGGNLPDAVHHRAGRAAFAQDDDVIAVEGEIFIRQRIQAGDGDVGGVLGGRGGAGHNEAGAGLQVSGKGHADAGGQRAVVILLQNVVLGRQVQIGQGSVIDFNGLVVAGAFDILRDENFGRRAAGGRVPHDFSAGDGPIGREWAITGQAAPGIKVLSASGHGAHFSIVYLHGSGGFRFGAKENHMRADRAGRRDAFGGVLGPVAVQRGNVANGVAAQLLRGGIQPFDFNLHVLGRPVGRGPEPSRGAIDFACLNGHVLRE